MTEHEKFMELALQQAQQALVEGEFPVGCVLVHQGRVVASGKRSNSSGKVNEMDHAEILALRTLLDNEQQVNMSDVTVYSTMEPCLMCFSTLLVNGIRKFVYSYEDAMGGGTNVPLDMLAPLYQDLQVKITKEILREKSLALFKDFFSSPENSYLKDSLLAEYTLKVK